MHPNMQAFTAGAGGKTNIEHTGSRSHGTGCKSKACYMQTDQGKSGARRMGRKTVREFITREWGTLIICVSFKSIFFFPFYCSCENFPPTSAHINKSLKEKVETKQPAVLWALSKYIWGGCSSCGRAGCLCRFDPWLLQPMLMRPRLAQGCVWTLNSPSCMCRIVRKFLKAENVALYVACSLTKM